MTYPSESKSPEPPLFWKDRPGSPLSLPPPSSSCKINYMQDIGAGGKRVNLLQKVLFQLKLITWVQACGPGEDRWQRALSLHPPSPHFSKIQQQKEIWRTDLVLQILTAFVLSFGDEPRCGEHKWAEKRLSPQPNLEYWIAPTLHLHQSHCIFFHQSMKT